MATSVPLRESGKMRASLLDLPYVAVERALARRGALPFHARALWRALYRAQDDLLEPAGWAPPLQRWVRDELGPEGDYVFDPPAEDLVTASADGFTRKFLLRLADGETIETVLMGYTGRTTVCVSTQAGCAMGCVFCATGQMGFTRQLQPGEIVAQVRHARRLEPQLRNLVLMGMGEPLHNYEAVMTALEIIRDPRGLNLIPRRITVSTVGLVPGIRRMAEEGQPYQLAVSLHAANDEDRNRMIPIGRRWPLAELMAACAYYVERTGQKIFFGWTLIAGQNDTPEHARELTALLTGIRSHVNLIPLNPTAGYAGFATDEEAVRRFQAILAEGRISSTVRQRRGIDVAAGCGQLKAAAAA